MTGSGPSGGLEQGLRGTGQTVHPVQFLVLVFDVDRHVGVDGFQGSDEPGPPSDVIAAPDGHEVPGRVLRPARQGVRPAQAQEAGLIWCDPAETVVPESR